ncbi:copper resistance protein CopC [bacterium]|nr:copper resistance protein CopC [bacterium]
MSRRLAVLAASLALLAAPTLARAHARLVGSSPRPDERLARPPAAIDLRFNEVLDAGFHEIAVVPAGESTAAARNRAGTPAIDPDDGTRLVAPLEALPDGAWVVSWRVLSRDGHGARGRFEFRVEHGRDGAR